VSPLRRKQSAVAVTQGFHLEPTPTPGFEVVMRRQRGCHSRRTEGIPPVLTPNKEEVSHPPQPQPLAGESTPLSTNIKALERGRKQPGRGVRGKAGFPE